MKQWRFQSFVWISCQELAHTCRSRETRSRRVRSLPFYHYYLAQEQEIISFIIKALCVINQTENEKCRLDWRPAFSMWLPCTKVTCSLLLNIIISCTCKSVEETTYNLQLYGLALHLDRADFLQAEPGKREGQKIKEHPQMPCSSDGRKRKTSRMHAAFQEEPTHKVNTNRADVAVHIGVVLEEHKGKNKS